MKTRINVFIVEDHQVVREGIISLIREDERFLIVGEAENGKIALTQIAALEFIPDVVLMDINMPVMDGIDCTKELVHRYPGKVKVLALTMVKQGLHIRGILQAGATGYILKNCDKIELFGAIEAVHEDKTYFSPAVKQEVMNEMLKIKADHPENQPVVLSKREQEVLELIVRDLSNQQIADALHISIRTVETHKQNMISKTGANNVAGLVVFAIKHRLVDIS